MGDMGDDFAAMSAARQRRHAVWKEKNTAILNAGGFVYTVANNGESFLFRTVGKPKADFFPSTGRWRSENKNYRGGATAFLAWYEKQSV